jgi:hypothetical protein
MWKEIRKDVNDFFRGEAGQWLKAALAFILIWGIIWLGLSSLNSNTDAQDRAAAQFSLKCAENQAVVVYMVDDDHTKYCGKIITPEPR